MTNDRKQGTLFAGRYLLERKLGSGGMADVWLARDQELSRNVAVKVLHERYANDEQFVERFRREATHAAGLSHPNIVSIFDRGEVEGSYYIVMEYVEGRTLKELIVTRGACPVPVAISYVRQVLAALRYAHRNGIIHRDIKPHNVIVDREGRAKVADFGIARAGTSQMTEVGSIIGTAQYLSPEQARGSVVDESSDLYSTGIVLYELLTGAVPFTGDTPVEIAMKHLSTPPAPPSTLRHEVPHDLDLVVLRALAKEPIDRYRSAQEMDHDLELVARGEPVGRETEEAATMVLRGETTAATVVAPVGSNGQERYRAFDGDVRTRRAIWPWLLGAGLALAIGIGGFFAWNGLSDRLDAGQTVAVDNYEGILESKAVQLIIDDGLEPRVRRLPNGEVAEGYTFDQEPAAGTELPKGGIVTVAVSTGKAKVAVPSLVGDTRDDAVKELTVLNLVANVVEVNSQKPGGIVIAQDPSPGTVLVAGSSVRVNVSKGPKPVAVPNVVGLQVDIATSQLNTAGFPVLPVQVESDRPAGEVVAQEPPGNTTTSKGATITLSVSKGPSTVTVPDVTLSRLTDARTTLTAAGFKSRTVQQQTDDETLDGVVVSQDPPGETQADPGSTVTLTVGLYVAPPVTDTTGTDTIPTVP
jgi:beta-lactam-binding protein with PASTA domain